MGKRERNRSLPAFRLERSQKHYRRRQYVGSVEMYACQTFGRRLFAAFSARLSFLTPRGLGNDLIVPMVRPPNMDAEIETTERLGGLLRSYRRAA